MMTNDEKFYIRPYIAAFSLRMGESDNGNVHATVVDNCNQMLFYLVKSDKIKKPLVITGEIELNSRITFTAVMAFMKTDDALFDQIELIIEHAVRTDNAGITILDPDGFMILHPTNYGYELGDITVDKRVKTKYKNRLEKIKSVVEDISDRKDLFKKYKKENIKYETRNDNWDFYDSCDYDSFVGPLIVFNVFDQTLSSRFRYNNTDYIYMLVELSLNTMIENEGIPDNLINKNALAHLSNCAKYMVSYRSSEDSESYEF